jgi:hypothetical protein
MTKMEELEQFIRVMRTQIAFCARTRRLWLIERLKPLLLLAVSLQDDMKTSGCYGSVSAEERDKLISFNLGHLRLAADDATELSMTKDILPSGLTITPDWTKEFGV